MLASAFEPQIGLRKSSRLPVFSRDAAISTAEILFLLLFGALAALAIGFLHLSLRIPGHAILRGVLPLAAGLAFVPRRSAGTVMAIGAAGTASIFSVAHLGSFPMSAMISVLLLGPVLDIALLGQAKGWWLYARFITAGIIANLLALGFKLVSVQFGLALIGGGEGFARFGIATLLVSYIACGAIAGFLGAVACFRLLPEGSSADDLRRD
jgi:hypothetical protein